MIHFNFAIGNPFRHSEWRDLYQGSWAVSQNKTLEVGFFRYAWNLIEVSVDLRWRGRDHAGPAIEIGLLGWSARIALVDNRHWDTASDSWEKHNSD